MEIRDFAANRSFSGNGLWQWYEKPGLSGPAIPAGSEQSWGRFEGRQKLREQIESAYRVDDLSQVDSASTCGCRLEVANRVVGTLHLFVEPFELGFHKRSIGIL
jgi:hypothetical protein